MSKLDNYQCDGQLDITDYMKSKIISNRVDDLTTHINKKGKSQYQQIKDIVYDTYDKNKDSDDLLNVLTNRISVYVLNQSIEYMNYLRKEME